MGLSLAEALREIDELKKVTGEKETYIEHGYVSDLLSDVMRNAKPNSLWITIQHHENVVAVALMVDISVVVFSSGLQPDENVVDRAQQENVTLCSYSGPSFQLVGELYELGLES